MVPSCGCHMFHVLGWYGLGVENLQLLREETNSPSLCPVYKYVRLALLVPENYGGWFNVPDFCHHI